MTTTALESRQPEQLELDDISRRQNIDRPGLRVGRLLTLEERFEEWIETPDGTTVKGEAARRAFQLRSRGFARYGIGAIIESIRFDRHIAVGPDGGFKLNNSYRSRLARRVMAEYPELDGFFETRELRS